MRSSETALSRATYSEWRKITREAVIIIIEIYMCEYRRRSKSKISFVPSRIIKI